MKVTIDVDEVTFDLYVGRFIDEEDVTVAVMVEDARTKKKTDWTVLPLEHLKEKDRNEAD